MFVTTSHVAAAATLAMVLVACGTAKPEAAPTTPAVETSSSPTPSAVPSAEPSIEPSPSASAEVVESDRHRYRITVPPDWTRIEYDGEWTALDQFGVGVEVPGEDVIDSAALGAFLVMNSMTLPDGMTGDEWLAALDAIVQPALPADCPGTPSRGMVSGAEAVTLTQDCAGTSIIGRSLTHAGRGYYFTTVAPSDGEAGPILEAMIASIRFLD